MVVNCLLEKVRPDSFVTIGCVINRWMTIDNQSTDNADMACIAACADREMSRVYYLMDSIAEAQFPPGTSCSSGHLQGTRSFCVAGRCVQFDNRNRLKFVSSQHSRSLLKLFKSAAHHSSSRLKRSKRSNAPILKPINLLNYD
jgi:hypothetical protein